ncbi:1-acyl-sn-glycerol-3-phosphate acyltransferase [Flavonifractor sp. An135]|mgnify:CR=1 FL=1|nr:lysophospholipid acyltransferase family protein [Flavonifractor sp. An135]OUQ24715.1 1-acyl-sn-glycerol-3-phosphate acyltransferase [Flavonifractor sp. An135]
MKSTRRWYSFLYCIVYPFFNLVHPGRVIGREHIPEGGLMICCNHTSDSDPLYLAFAFRLKNQIRPMAKAELLRIPVVGFLLAKAGIFGVERGKSDIGAVKQAMKYLREGEKVLVFPEGTRVHESRGEVSHPKAGAAMLAVRCGVPILPVYIPEKKKWFRRTPVVIGEPFTPTVATRKGTQEEYEAITADLMSRIRALKELAG